MNEDHFSVFTPIPVMDGESFNTPRELSEYSLVMIHCGLLIPNDKSIKSMSRELLKHRGVPNPDLI